MGKLRVLSLFSGIGAFEEALEKSKVQYELVGFSEIDKYAIASYCAIHGESSSKCIGDIREVGISDVPDCDLVTYGFPCQAYSVAGKQQGLKDKRGGLFYDALRVIKGKKPKYCIAENVKGLTSAKFKEVFDDMRQQLDEAGYNTYWEIRNAKDFGLAQNRERVFLVSIRKDIDKGFTFPAGLLEGKTLESILQKGVDKKYHIRDGVKRMGRHKKEVTVSANNIVTVGQVSNKGSQGGKVYGIEGVFPTICACTHGYAMGNVKDAGGYVRRLTPKECWLLQGFDGRKYEIARMALLEAFYKGKDRADTQLYKQAGNSIAVPVLEGIFKELLKEYI